MLAAKAGATPLLFLEGVSSPTELANALIDMPPPQLLCLAFVTRRPAHPLSFTTAREGTLLLSGASLESAKSWRLPSPPAPPWRRAEVLQPALLEVKFATPTPLQVLVHGRLDLDEVENSIATRQRIKLVERIELLSTRYKDLLVVGHLGQAPPPSQKLDLRRRLSLADQDNLSLIHALYTTKPGPGEGGLYAAFFPKVAPLNISGLSAPQDSSMLSLVIERNSWSVPESPAR